MTPGIQRRFPPLMSPAFLRNDVNPGIPGKLSVDITVFLEIIDPWTSPPDGRAIGRLEVAVRAREQGWDAVN